MDELFVELFQSFVVSGHVLRDGGEIETKGAVELDIDEAGREDLAAQVDDFIWNDMVVVEYLLAMEDLACDGADPEIFFDESVAFDY